MKKIFIIPVILFITILYTSNLMADQIRVTLGPGNGASSNGEALVEVDYISESKYSPIFWYLDSIVIGFASGTIGFDTGEKSEDDKQIFKSAPKNKLLFGLEGLIITNDRYFRTAFLVNISFNVFT